MHPGSSKGRVLWAFSLLEWLISKDLSVFGLFHCLRTIVPEKTKAILFADWGSRGLCTSYGIVKFPGDAGSNSVAVPCRSKKSRGAWNNMRRQMSSDLVRILLLGKLVPTTKPWLQGVVVEMVGSERWLRFVFSSRLLLQIQPVPCSTQHYHVWCVLIYVQLPICTYPVQRIRFFLLLFCACSVMLNYFLVTALL